jgi:hypothetical protein
MRCLLLLPSLQPQTSALGARWARFGHPTQAIPVHAVARHEGIHKRESARTDDMRITNSVRHKPSTTNSGATSPPRASRSALFSNRASGTAECCKCGCGRVAARLTEH